MSGNFDGGAPGQSSNGPQKMEMSEGGEKNRGCCGGCVVM
jgi:hypothetical protein